MSRNIRAFVLWAQVEHVFVVTRGGADCGLWQRAGLVVNQGEQVRGRDYRSSFCCRLGVTENAPSR